MMTNPDAWAWRLANPYVGVLLTAPGLVHLARTLGELVEDSRQRRREARREPEYSWW